jgi:hypothetical protein
MWRVEGSFRRDIDYDTLVQMALYLAQYNRIIRECIDVKSFFFTEGRLRDGVLVLILQDRIQFPMCLSLLYRGDRPRNAQPTSCSVAPGPAAAGHQE